ncbi:hypothetical protein GCM10028777_02130 [Angustibacter speluncae]
MRAAVRRSVVGTCVAGLLGVLGVGLAAAGSGSVEVARLNAESGTAAAVEDDYTRVVELFDQEPEAWGGAYVDDETLVVTTVTRTPEQAVVVLADRGLTGDVEVRQGDVSRAELAAAVDTLSGDPAVRSVASAVGPDHRTGTIVVGVRHWFVPPRAVSPVPIPLQVNGIPVRMQYEGAPAPVG